MPAQFIFQLPTTPRRSVDPSASLQNLAFCSSAIIRAQIIPFLFSPFTALLISPRRYHFTRIIQQFDPSNAHLRRKLNRHSSFPQVSELLPFPCCSLPLSPRLQASSATLEYLTGPTSKASNIPGEEVLVQIEGPFDASVSGGVVVVELPAWSVGVVTIEV